MLQDKFLSLIEEHEPMLKKISRLSDIVGFIKLFLVGLFVVSIVLTAVADLWFLVLLLVVFIVLIIFFVYHSKLNEKIDFHKGMISICNRHIDRINGKWIDFKDKGTEFVNTEHPYSSDLDIVGEKSLFQLLNTTSTWHGRRAFANDLLNADYNQNELKNRQEAIAELSENTRYTAKAQYYFSKVKVDEKAPKLVEELTDNTPFMTNLISKFILSVIPLVSLATIIGLLI